ncbi:MAG: hypothetical protein ABSA70_05010 [Terriglobia bacterium]
MAEQTDFHVPKCDEFRRGYEKYNQLERLGPIYFEALQIVSGNWGNPTAMASGIERLIRAWNRFYAHFDFSKLTDCINKNLALLSELKPRHISALSASDEATIRSLFKDFFEALRRTNDLAGSAVSVAKALSPLATHFLPLWDSNIALAYDCFYLADSADAPYIDFCKKMKLLAGKVADCVPIPDDRSLLKRIDEYNYSKYTRHWI